MARYAVLDAQGEVVNVVEWDGETPFQIEGCKLRLAVEGDFMRADNEAADEEQRKS